MRGLMRRWPGSLFVLTLLATGVACGDSTGPGEPEAITIEGGNNQNGSTGSPLGEMLSVRVTGTGGEPFAGATVRWEVESGDAEVSPETSSTDANGIARTTVTLGSMAGAVVVSATVDGLAAVSFSANAVAACDNIEPHTIGSTVNGTLTTDDCLSTDNSRVDRFRFALTEARSIRFSESSTAMNPFLSVHAENRDLIGFHDDLTTTDRNARLRVFLVPGTYELLASGFGPTDLGAYTLTSEVATGAVEGCGFFETWVVRGVQLTQDLASTDCELNTQDGNDYYYDLYFVYLRQGETLSVTQSSTAIDSYLELYRVTTSLEFIDSNDDSGTSNDAGFTHQALVSGVYLILSSSSAARETGAYTLTVS